MTNVVKLLQELIALPSVNPAFLPAGDPRGGEERIGHFVAATAAQAGLDVHFQKVLRKRQNVLAILPPKGQFQDRVILAPHLDTVPDSAPGQFVPKRRNGRLYGRGACDTKGSVAAMLSALIQVAKAPQRPQHTEIVFAGLIDEEASQLGARALAASGIEAGLAVVGEPTRLQVVTAHKGDLWLRLRVRGKAAHGALPSLGRNAVHLMARLVDALETDYARTLRRKKHPLLGHPTISVGSIRGGSQPNIVPDRCEIEVDRRMIPGETEASVRKEIRDFLRHRGFRPAMEDSKGVPCLPLQTDPAHPLIRLLMRATDCRKKAGVHFFCDAGVLANGGIPSVAFGPGDIAQAHTTDEWISLGQLKKATAQLTRFLKSLP